MQNTYVVYSSCVKINKFPFLLYHDFHFIAYDI